MQCDQVLLLKGEYRSLRVPIFNVASLFQNCEQLREDNGLAWHTLCVRQCTPCGVG
jgi:hypothetical protein